MKNAFGGDNQDSVLDWLRAGLGDRNESLARRAIPRSESIPSK
jgi:hypothetical protein